MTRESLMLVALLNLFYPDSTTLSARRLSQNRWWHRAYYYSVLHLARIWFVNKSQHNKICNWLPRVRSKSDHSNYVTSVFYTWHRSDLLTKANIIKSATDYQGYDPKVIIQTMFARYFDNSKKKLNKVFNIGQFPMFLNLNLNRRLHDDFVHHTRK